MDTQVHSKTRSANYHKHWFIDEEFKWRTLASAVWSWLLTFAVLATFIIFVSIHPSRHFYVLYDVLSTLSTVRTWLIILIIASLTAFLIRLYYTYYDVAPVYPSSRMSVIMKVLSPFRLVYALASALFGTVTAHLITHLTGSPYSYVYYACSYNTKDGTVNEFCINEPWFILVLFGFVLGVVHSMNFFVNHNNTLTFQYVQMFLYFPDVVFLDLRKSGPNLENLNLLPFARPRQEARFLYIKCKLSSMIYECVCHSLTYTRYFSFVYYFVGFLPRDSFAYMFGVLPSEYHLLSVWRIFAMIPVLWHLCLFGTLLLFLWELSWQLFNIYNTQNYNFLFESVFPEDKQKLLLENLDTNSPPIVQHLAFQHLSLISRQSSEKRQLIFALSNQAENGQPYWWNRVVDSCVGRLERLSEQLSQHQLMLSINGTAGYWKTSASSVSSNSSSGSKSDISPGSITVLRRRPLSAVDTSYANATNISCLNVSSINTTTGLARGYGKDPATLALNQSSFSVPTPRLWSASANNPVCEVENSSYASSFNKEHDQNYKHKQNSKLTNFVSNLKSLPIISYFVTKMPNNLLLSLYREHNILKWAMQSLSYLCAASISEDKFGVVQTRLHEVIAALINLLVALEKLGKYPGSSVRVNRLYNCLLNETKISLHRIADAFDHSLSAVNLSQEHRRRMQSFMTYNQ